MHSAPIGVLDDVGFKLFSMLDTDHPSFSLLRVSRNQSMIQSGIQVVDLHKLRSEGRYMHDVENLFLFMTEHDLWFSDQVFLSLLIFSPRFHLNHTSFPSDFLYVWAPHVRAVKNTQIFDSCHENHNCIIHWNGDKPWRNSELWGIDIWNAYACQAASIVDL